MGEWLYSWRDPADSWRGEDKVAHAFGAAFAACVAGPVVAVLASVLVEAVEVWRWSRLTAAQHLAIKGGQRPWPWLTDRVSLKDLLADAAGIGLALLVEVAHR